MCTHMRIHKYVTGGAHCAPHALNRVKCIAFFLLSYCLDESLGLFSLFHFLILCESSFSFHLNLFTSLASDYPQIPEGNVNVFIRISILSRRADLKCCYCSFSTLRDGTTRDARPAPPLPAEKRLPRNATQCPTP